MSIDEVLSQMKNDKEKQEFLAAEIKKNESILQILYIKSREIVYKPTSYGSVRRD